MTLNDLRRNIRYAISLRGTSIRRITRKPPGKELTTDPVADISERQLQYFLAGDADMTLGKFFSLCEALGMSVEAVMNLRAPQ